MKEKISQEIQRRKNIYSTRYRIEYPGAVYHIIQRAPGNEKLFSEDEDYLRMISLIKETTINFNWKIFSFVLMSNHIHILLQINKENLSQGAKFLFQSYAKGFNKKYKRKGPVFCRPYKAFLCLNDPYLLAISIYIHLNPSKTGLVNDPLRYRWSSINLFLKSGNFNSFVDYKFILSLLSNNISTARILYQKLLYEASNLEYKNIPEQSNFIQKFCSQINKLGKALGKTKINFESKLETELNKLKQMKYSRKYKKRKKQLIERLINQGYPKFEIAKLLNISRIQLYRILQK